MEGKTYQITPGKSTVPADAATVPSGSFNGTRYDA
jgi:hypothetical protein